MVPVYGGGCGNGLFSSVKEHDLGQYLREIGKHELLNHDEEVEIANRIRDAGLNDRERLCARDRLIECNLRLVVSIAKEFARGKVPLHELIAEGNIGLIKAVSRFDPGRGCRFSTYATYWIRQSVRLAARQFQRRRKLPDGETENVRKLVSLDEVLRVHPIEDHKEESQVGSEEVDKLHGVLNVLNVRESEIVKLRYESALTLGEIGEKLGITRERVRQIEENAIHKLQREFRRTAG